ncbi:hypothetical protein [Acinetobacter junii]|uniref:hypothetical protein n=1 Tax=Acinetobacter junii TaxID=40215 RepID=UPI0024482791|nr:hypothetical protein [Acinetobacter junii]MDH0718217.1 hypothetical protein [Acinetobacter junii]
MSLRPILFNTPMVKAILEGRKTQTRRVMRRQPDKVERFKHGVETADTDARYAILRCYNRPKMFKKCNSGWFADASYKTPFTEFNVGDHLWVRETWRKYDCDECPCYEYCNCPPHGTYLYYADCLDDEAKWKPSIHMPRSASRILLEITNIRVERVQDISEADATAEGMIADDDYCAEEYFSILWNELNGWAEKGWNANPWVWCIEFRVIQGGAE